MDPLLLISQNTELARIYAEEQKKLYAFILSRVKSVEEAEDILHDVFLELVKTYRKSSPVAVVQAFLMTVAKNKIIDRSRKKQYKCEFPADFALQSDSFSSLQLGHLTKDMNEPEIILFRQLVTARLQSALDELSDTQRMVFIRHELEGKSFQEIETETGENINTLLSRKRYAVLHIRRRLKDLYEDLQS